MRPLIDEVLELILHQSRFAIKKWGVTYGVYGCLTQSLIPIIGQQIVTHYNIVMVTQQLTQEV